MRNRIPRHGSGRPARLARVAALVGAVALLLVAAWAVGAGRVSRSAHAAIPSGTGLRWPAQPAVGRPAGPRRGYLAVAHPLPLRRGYLAVARSLPLRRGHLVVPQRRGRNGWAPFGDGIGSLEDLGAVPAGWTDSEHTLTSGGLERTYLMIRPPAGDPGTIPVVVALAGRTMDPVQMERLSRLIPVLHAAIVVYPDGYGYSWNAGACCGIAHYDGIDDVAFLEAVIHQVLATQPDASPHDVYLVGFSNGGRMAYRMACEDPGAFAGVAVVEAVPVFDCAHLFPTPFTIVAQTGDPLLTVPADGTPRKVEGYVEPTVEATVGAWRRLEGCGSPPAVTTLGSVRVTVYDDCAGQGRLEYDLYSGGGHVWPDGSADTPSAGQLIWPFLHTGALPSHDGSWPTARPVRSRGDLGRWSPARPGARGRATRDV